MRTNRYPGQCARCGADVPADQGTLQGPPWRTICKSCLPWPAARKPVIELVPRGDRIEVCLRDRLNGAFAAYRAACEGLTTSRKVAGRWVTTCAPESAPELIERLSAIDTVVVKVSDAVRAKLEAQAETQRADLDAADDRIEAIDAELAKRGQALYGYQRTGIPWLAARTTGLLADDMGLGKTLQALLAAPAEAPILVVCPAVAKGVWVREAAKWRPDLTAVALKGRKSFRWPASRELIVTNYDILPGLISGHRAILSSELEEACPQGVVVIADEAHAVKSSKAHRTKKLSALMDLARKRGGRTWLLTATPILNQPPELWSLLGVGGMRETFGSWPRFVEAFRGYKGRWGYQWGTPSQDAVDALKRVQLRRLKSDVLTDLPAKRYQVVEVNGLDRAARKACDEAVAALAEIGVDLEKAEKVTEASEGGVVFQAMSAARAALATAKTPHVLELALQYEESGEPVAVFSAHRAPIDALAQRDGWAAITGSTPAEERSRIESAFQSGELNGIACTIQAGGIAITLTHASHAIFVDRLYTPALNVQAEDRIHRIGQDRGVLIIDLVADHALDKQLNRILCRKEGLIASSVDRAVGDKEREDLDVAIARALELEILAMDSWACEDS